MNPQEVNVYSENGPWRTTSTELITNTLSRSSFGLKNNTIVQFSNDKILQRLRLHFSIDTIFL